MRRAVTSADLTAGDIGKQLTVRAGTDYEKYDLEDWRPVVDYDTNATDTSVTAGVTIPANGTWDIEVLGMFHYIVNGSGIEMKVNILENAVPVAGGSAAESATPGPHAQSVPVNYHLLGATNSTLYTYTITTGHTGSPSQPQAAPRDVHTLFVRATRSA